MYRIVYKETIEYGIGGGTFVTEGKPESLCASYTDGVQKKLTLQKGLYRYTKGGTEERLRTS